MESSSAPLARRPERTDDIVSSHGTSGSAVVVFCLRLIGRCLFFVFFCPFSFLAPLRTILYQTSVLNDVHNQYARHPYSFARFAYYDEETRIFEFKAIKSHTPAHKKSSLPLDTHQLVEKATPLRLVAVWLYLLHTCIPPTRYHVVEQ